MLSSTTADDVPDVRLTKTQLETLHKILGTPTTHGSLATQEFNTVLLNNNTSTEVQQPPGQGKQQIQVYSRRNRSPETDTAVSITSPTEDCSETEVSPPSPSIYLPIVVRKGLDNCGLFHANARFDDTELGIVAKNIGDHICRYFPQATILLLDNKKLEAVPKGKGQSPVMQYGSTARVILSVVVGKSCISSLRFTVIGVKISGLEGSVALYIHVSFIQGMHPRNGNWLIPDGGSQLGLAESRTLQIRSFIGWIKVMADAETCSARLRS
ncbi:hypothetical protein GOBAR_DD04822 [Gossypium barbadense]|nr:hypothetical protein GOBAR_DD04822 [Gossypium barbadense]